MTTIRNEAEARARLRDIGVSRETEERLERFADLLLRWTRRVNLIAPSTTGALWSRHILDSAQLYALAPPGPGLWLDMGSGGGLPGVVCAILAGGSPCPAPRFVFVESDRRKCAFLATCVRAFDLDATVHAARIEDLPEQCATVVSSRALAPLSRLFAFAERHATAGATLLLHKGARHEEEIAEARATWRFTVEAHPSITDPAARILACRVQGRKPGGRAEQT